MRARAHKYTHPISSETILFNNFTYTLTGILIYNKHTMWPEKENFEYFQIVEVLYVTNVAE